MNQPTDTKQAAIAHLVDRGLAIEAEIEALKKELKQIEEGLSTAALAASKEGLTEPLVDEEREGQRFLAKGTTATIPVILESDQIAGEFGEDTEKAQLLKALCGDRLAHLYKRVVGYARVPKDGKAFRTAAIAHWPADEAAKIISAAISRDKHGIPKSRVVVAWDQAK
jgi:hypothetical protein